MISYGICLLFSVFICLFIRQRFYTLKMFGIYFGSKAVIPNSYNFILGSTFKCTGRYGRDSQWPSNLAHCLYQKTQSSPARLVAQNENPYFPNKIGLLDWVLDHDKEALSAEWLSPRIFSERQLVFYTFVKKKNSISRRMYVGGLQTHSIRWKINCTKFQGHTTSVEILGVQ